MAATGDVLYSRDPLDVVEAPRKMCASVPVRPVSPPHRRHLVPQEPGGSRAVPPLFRSKSIRFGLMSNQEIQKVAEFHVFERNLYQMPQRVPMKNGILDQRLVRRSSRTPTVPVGQSPW